MYETGFTGTQIIRLDTVDSTNNYAAKLVKDVKVHEGTVIMAHTQTSGKGQRGNTWTSLPGKNITLSIVYYPRTIDARNQFALSQVTALAISDLLLSFHINNVIKWPNDIYTAAGKICGILIENTYSDQSISHSIVGIGLNVNQSPQGTAYPATCMQALTGHTHNLDAVLELLCRFMDKWYLLMLQSKFDFIKNTYLLRMLHFAKLATYTYKGETIQAVITDVEPAGRLVLQQDNGERIYADLKEISFVI